MQRSKIARNKATATAAIFGLPQKGKRRSLRNVVDNLPYKKPPLVRGGGLPQARRRGSPIKLPARVYFTFFPKGKYIAFAQANISRTIRCISHAKRISQTYSKPPIVRGGGLPIGKTEG